MTYNRFHYNTALWNAGREDAPALARSIIQAHTGPHVQAVIGASGGTTLVSDFVITEGTVKKPPQQYKFPDMTAFIRAYQVRPSSEGSDGEFAINDIAAFLRSIGYGDMAACIFLVNHLPDLPAKIFGLFEATLLATIVGELGRHDLPAVIQATVANLAGTMLGIPAPNLPARIFVQPPGDLRARIWSPTDLGAILGPVQFTDLPGSIRGFQFADMPGFMLGIPSPQILAFIRGVAADIKNLPARTVPLAFVPGMPAAITPVFTGETGFAVGLLASIQDDGVRSANFPAFLRSVEPAVGDLLAFIRTADSEKDLPAIIQLLGAGNLPALINLIPVGEKDRFLNAFAQPVHPSDLGAEMTISQNVAFLGAIILALSGTADLGARLRVAETFVTALLTISTLTHRDLRATIGKPGCSGGSASVNLSAFADVQHAKNLGAFLESFLEKNLGASINSPDTFFALDTINVKFTPSELPSDPTFLATDTIEILFSPFRGKNLGAILNAIQNNVFLNATLTPVFPLPRVVPAVNRLTAADLRLTEPQNIQEIRLQLEGALLEYIYVNGTETSFIKDPNEDWKINVRSFKPIAEGLFGDRAAAKVCRLGGLTQFRTVDEAVRFCIQAVLGFQSEQDMSAQITAKGGVKSLTAVLTPQNTFGDLSAIANRVYPVDLGAFVDVNSVSGTTVLTAFIQSTVSGVLADLGATIDDVREGTLSGTLTTSGGQPFLPNILNAFLLNSRIGVTEIKSLAATIDDEKNTQSLYFSGSGSNEYISVDTLENLGFGLGRQFTIAFWIRWDPNSADGNPTDAGGSPVVFDSILGASSGAPAQRLPGGGIPGWKDGFGFYWELDGASINFWVNDFEVYNAFAVMDEFEEFPQWVHIAGVYDADAASSNVRIYINGNSGGGADALTADLNALPNTVLEIGRVGADQRPDAYPNHWMDEIGIWPNVALSGTEIAAIFDPGFQHHNLTVNRGAYVHADDLAVYYQFEDTDISFPTVINAVSSGTFDGTMVNMDVSTNLSTRTLETDSNSMHLDSTGYFENNADADLPLALNGQGSFTTVMWIRPEFNGDRRILGLWHSSDTAGSEPTLWVGHDNDQGGQQRFRVQMNTQADDPISMYAQFNIDVTAPYTWYHLAIVYDANTLECKFYVNNVFRNSATLSAARKRVNEFTLNSARFNNGTGSHFIGSWDMNAWWDRALTEDELTEIWNGGTSGGEVDLTKLESSKDDLTAWYRLGEVPDQRIFLRNRLSKTQFVSGNMDNIGGSGFEITSDTPFNPDS